MGALKKRLKDVQKAFDYHFWLLHDKSKTTLVPGTLNLRDSCFYVGDSRSLN